MGGGGGRLCCSEDGAMFRRRSAQHSAQRPAGRRDRQGTRWRSGRMLGREMALALQHYHEILENGKGAILRL